MRGGTSKGCLFHREDLPEDSKEWDEIFLQVMGNPDPKQMDGMGGTVSSNNKIVIIWKSALPNVDIEYLVGQVIVGKKQVDYKSNCGNMTAAVPAYAVEEGMVPIVEPVTTVRMLNKNTDKYINVTVPIDPRTHTFAQEGDCHIAGIDGTAAELKVNFLDPAGAKTGKLLPRAKHWMCWKSTDGKSKPPSWMYPIPWSWSGRKMWASRVRNCRHRWMRTKKHRLCWKKSGERLL